MDDVTKVLTAHFEDCLDKHGATPRGMDWRRPTDLFLRFGIMLRVILPDEQQASLLDVGCGIGLLLDYLSITHYPIKQYIGVDASHKIINVARKRHPNAEFLCADICDPQANLPKCDYVVTNGMFNEKRHLSVGAMDQFFETAVMNMFQLCTKGIAFNVMSSYVNYRADALYYKDPREVFSFSVEELSRFVRIYHDYPLYEFFTCVYRAMPMRQ